MFVIVWTCVAQEFICWNPDSTLHTRTIVAVFRDGVFKEVHFSSVWFSHSVVSNSLQHKDSSTPGFPVHHQLLDFIQTHVHRVSDAIQASHPLSSPSPPLIFPSIRVFSNESTLHIRWPKYRSFSFSISSSKEYSGLVSFRIEWLDLFAVQRTLKSLFQHHSLKASIFQHSAFFRVQLSHPYMTTGKTMALTIWSFVSKMMSLLS